MNEPDELLYLIVLAATEIDASTQGRTQYRITLALHGVVVSGTIISAAEYGRSHTLVDSLDELMRAQQTPEQRAKLDFATLHGSGFVHLKDTRLEGGTTAQYPNDLGSGYFRCRLADVNGFWL